MGTGSHYHPNIFAPRSLRVTVTPSDPSPNKGKPYRIRSKKGAKLEEGVKQTVLKALGLTPLAINAGAAEPKWSLPIVNPEEGWNLGQWLAPPGSGLAPYDVYFDIDYVLSTPGKRSRKFTLKKCKAEKGFANLDAGENEIANELSGMCCDIELDGQSVFGDKENR